MSVEGGRNFDRNIVTAMPEVVYENFRYSDEDEVYTSPFASKVEAQGFLTGSENVVLCSKRDALYSTGFVQCGGALIRNRDTELVSVIHQSRWSTAAGGILAMQRSDDLDVIVFNGPIGHMGYSTVEAFHTRERMADYYEAFKRIDRDDRMIYPNAEISKKNMRHVFLDYSRILGISKNEIEAMFIRSMKDDSVVGRTRLVGDIKVPVSRKESGRLSMLYRPSENVVWIYDSGKMQLFKYPGFSK